MRLCRIFRVNGHYTLPFKNRDIEQALLKRALWKPGDPPLASRLMVITDSMVPLTLRLGDRTLMDLPEERQETRILGILKQRSRIGSQLDSAREHFNTSLDMLENAGKSSLAKALIDLYPTVIDYLVLATRGEQKNPVHHSLVVLENAVRIGLGDDLTDSDLKVLCVSAFIHDIGCCASVRDRVLPAHIKAEKDENKRAQMITEGILFRREHMEKGEKIAGNLLNSGSISSHFTKPEKGRIKMLVATHDNPGIENYMQVPSGQWLFFSQERLALLLRAADRLWMLTPEGLEADLERDKRKGKLVDPRSHLQHNINEHRKEREAYDIFEDAAEKYGFIGNTLHISLTGYALHNEYIEQTCLAYSINPECLVCPVSPVV
ncbi:MAG: HD domain-containing protein [Candidatus Margulisiibacteriota bacterium]